jgi:hypothetical protein
MVWAAAHGYPTTQRIQKMFNSYLRRFRDGREIETLVPVRQFLGVPVEGSQLRSIELNTKQFENVVSQAGHLARLYAPGLLAFLYNWQI